MRTKCRLESRANSKSSANEAERRARDDRSAGAAEERKSEIRLCSQYRYSIYRYKGREDGLVSGFVGERDGEGTEKETSERTSHKKRV